MRQKTILVCTALALAAASLASAGQAPGAPDEARLAALAGHVQEALAAQRGLAEAGAAAAHGGKARVPRKDQATATVVGTINAISFEEILDDGTPFTVVFVSSRTGSLLQEFWIFCVGSSRANGSDACQRLREGRRVSFNGVLVVVEDDEGFSTPDNIIGATRITGG